MRTYKDYVKNPKRVEGCIANRYVLDEAILYCMEYIPNGRKGTHKRGWPTLMDDNADKEQPLDNGNAIHLETLKYEQVRRWVLSSYDGIEEWEKMISPLQSTPSLPNPSEPLPIPAGGSHDEHSTTSGGDSSKIKIPLKLSLLGHVVGKNSTKFMSRLGNLVREHIPPYYPDWSAVPDRFKDTVWQIMYSFLVGHTRSDGTFPTALVAEKVIAVKEIIAKNPQSKYLDVDHDPLARVFGNESYIDLENRFSQYKAENDVKLDSLRDMVTSLRSFEHAATPTVNVDRSRYHMLFIVRCFHLFCEEAITHFLDLHKNIVASGRALVIPGYQESEEAEYEVIVDIIFEQGSPVFGQRGVFFDELLIGTKIKYPRILLRFGY
ncbi:hypothetical protein GIB67_027191 [Kingdonia uniflora]|uniref:Uncharacterized protein n=1 Tax=Kingdonia uniflora TaxID=39325 RepID=A0A7J7LBT0_9MAGN|nr:hypothetical protein GIB67_027191 [Kingdonia uniflora]